MNDETGSDRVTIRRTGGFGGLEVRGELSGDQLSPSEADLLRSLVARRDDGAQPAPGAADVMRYEMLVRLDGRSHELVWTDLTLPPALRPLVERALAHRAR